MQNSLFIKNPSQFIHFGILLAILLVVQYISYLSHMNKFKNDTLREDIIKFSYKISLTYGLFVLCLDGVFLYDYSIASTPFIFAIVFVIGIVYLIIKKMLDNKEKTLLETTEKSRINLIKIIFLKFYYSLKYMVLLLCFIVLIPYFLNPTVDKDRYLYYFTKFDYLYIGLFLIIYYITLYFDYKKRKIWEKEYENQLILSHFFYYAKTPLFLFFLTFVFSTKGLGDWGLLFIILFFSLFLYVEHIYQKFHDKLEPYLKDDKNLQFAENLTSVFYINLVMQIFIILIFHSSFSAKVFY